MIILIRITFIYSGERSLKAPIRFRLFRYISSMWRNVKGLCGRLSQILFPLFIRRSRGCGSHVTEVFEFSKAAVYHLRCKFKLVMEVICYCRINVSRTTHRWSLMHTEENFTDQVLNFSVLWTISFSHFGACKTARSMLSNIHHWDSTEKTRGSYPSADIRTSCNISFHDNVGLFAKPIPLAIVSLLFVSIRFYIIAGTQLCELSSRLSLRFFISDTVSPCSLGSFHFGNFLAFFFIPLFPQWST